MARTIRRFDVWLTDLGPALGAEIRKIRPCLIVSLDSMNSHLQTVTVLPMTTTFHRYPTRVDCVFRGLEGQLIIEQIKSVAKSRLKKRLGVMDERYCRNACQAIVEAYKWK